MNINLRIISGIQSTHCALVILKLKLPVIISCVAICFLNKEQNLDITLLHHCDDELQQILLYGSRKFSSSVNNKVFLLTIEFLELTKRFDQFVF